MSEAFNDVDTEQPAASVTPRGRATIRFPYFDLADAQELASAVFHNGGSSLTLDSLAASLNSTTTSSAFRGRVASAATFGVLETQRGSGRVALTTLGTRLADPQLAAGALVVAFLAVPLYRKVYDFYRGGMLPGDSGFENQLVEFGVPVKQAAKARQVLMRSAETAGFLRMGRTRLVKPEQGSVESQGGEAADTDAGQQRSDRAGEEVAVVETHPLIRGLLQVLPTPGQPLSQRDRERWLKTLDMNLAYIYPEPPARPDSVTPAEPTNGQQQPA